MTLQLAKMPTSAPRHTHQLVPIARITVDPRVQRSLNKRRAQQIADTFLIEAMGTVTLSERRDGTIVILDGQHRISAARLSGYSGSVEANVYHGLTVPQEADLFLKLNTQKVPTKVDKFIIGVLGEDAKYCAINDIVTHYGWSVDRSSGPAKITAVAALEAIYDGTKVGSHTGHRPDLVDATIETITAAWGHDGGAVKASLLLGVAGVYARYGKRVDPDRLVAKMGATTPQSLLANGASARAFVGGTEYAGVSRWLTTEYNKSLQKNRLPDWQWLK
jgi:hypothetical protein